MKKYLLVVLSIALLSCSQGDQPVSSPEPIEESFYEWKMITSWPKNLPALGTSPEYFAEIVETMSNGRMKIRVYGANELVGGLEVFDAVSQGVAEIGHSGAYYWQGKIPGTPFFSSIPFNNSINWRSFPPIFSELIRYNIFNQFLKLIFI